MKRKRKLGLVTTLMAAVALLGATAAQASTITVGSVLPPGFSSEPFGEQVTLLNTTLPEKGANLVSPVGGAIVRWRVQGAKGGPFTLRVLHPTGTGAYTASGTSAAVTPADAGLQTFTTNLPIHSGDLIGIDPTNPTDEIGVVKVPAAGFTSIFPRPLDGATVPARDPKSGVEIELSAEVQPTPTVTSVSGGPGSIAGGATVKITGTDFTGASAVKFGDTPAASFAVVSETEITATAPATTKASQVDIAVTTIAGTSVASGGDRFTYQACIVPQLKDRKLKAAKARLRSAGCKIGKVKKLDGATGKTGLVSKQGVKPGKTRLPGTKVNVTLATKKK
jgi:IPT/TIG domain/PASTA domain